jgi:quinol monooxygenase YgiN
MNETSSPESMKVVHDVYFALVDPSPENKEILVREGVAYLKGHPGMASFSAGVRAERMQRDVNDCGFDVSMHSVFVDAEAHDAYQSSPRHMEFVARIKARCTKVRVFDSYLRV